MVFVLLSILVIALYLSFGAIAATDAKSASGSPSPVMDPKVLEMLKPGPEHRALAVMVGTWDVACTMWSKADSQPMRSQGTCAFSALFDGRFLQGDFRSTHMGQSFVGHALKGYDRAAKHFITTWCDSMSTGFTYLTGSSRDGGRVITYEGDMVCPSDGKDALLRFIESHESSDRFSEVMYQTKDGKEYKAMELIYTRRS